VTKYNGMHWVEGLPEFASMISAALALAAKRRAVISEIAGRFPLDRVVDAYRALEAGAPGKVLVVAR
jgi:NADPH2:quinone reductase